MRLSLSPLTGARAQLDALLRSSFISALAAPHRVDDYLQLFDPAWSVHEARARVVETRQERGGGVSIVLAPNRAWRGFRAGQYVRLGIERQGVRHTRCFSISSAPADGMPLRISMRAFPGGKVSSWALEAARKNEVVWLSQALGAFVLPDSLPSKLLFVSAGSGVTPVLSMVRELARVQHRSAVTWLHYGRSETMLEDEVLALASAQPWLRVVLTRTDGPNVAPAELRHFSHEALAQHAPGWLEHEAFVCGPPALLSTAQTLFAAHGRAHQLHIESFGEGGSSVVQALGGARLPAQIRFAKSQREIAGNTGMSLLEQAEAAGLTPAYGCRMGICHTCKCRKLSGTVRDVRTGIESDQPDEEIRICVSVPRSDVTLDL